MRGQDVGRVYYGWHQLKDVKFDGPDVESTGFKRGDRIVTSEKQTGTFIGTMRIDHEGQKDVLIVVCGLDEFLPNYCVFLPDKISKEEK